MRVCPHARTPWMLPWMDPGGEMGQKMEGKSGANTRTYPDLLPTRVFQQSSVKLSSNTSIFLGKNCTHIPQCNSSWEMRREWMDGGFQTGWSELVRPLIVNSHVNTVLAIYCDSFNVQLTIVVKHVDIETNCLFWHFGHPQKWNTS